MNKKLLALLLCLTMSVVFLGGCKDGKPSGGDEKKWKIGFANIGEIVQLQIEVKESVQRAAEKYGVELVYMNNDMNGATAVQNADNMIQQKIDGFIEFNIDESVGPTIKEKMDAAGIPIIAVDISIPGCTFFGADNKKAGTVAGERLGQVAKERWNQEPDLLLLVYDSTSGETPMARVTEMPTGLRKIYPNFPESKIFKVDGGNDAASAQTAVSDFLAAHPNEKHIAIGTFHEIYATAALAAVETAGRQNDCIMVSNNEYAYLDYLKANPNPPANEVYVGAVAFFFDRYGEYLIPAMIDLLEGKNIGEKISVDHVVITRENANEYFAEYMKG